MLKRIILAFVIALTATHARATIEIAVKPEKVAVGELVQLTIEGIDPAMLPETKAFCWPETGTTFIPAKLWDSRPVIFFQAKLPGEYLIYVNSPIAGEDRTEDVKVVITVSGEGPAPDPFPDPRPEPIPDGELSIVVISETQTRTAKEAAALGKLRSYWESNQQEYFRQIVDPDIVSGSTNRTPEWLVPYLEAVTTRPVTLPVIVFVRTSPDGRFSVVAVESLPDGDAAVELVKRYEVKP